MRLIDADALWTEFNNADWYDNADRDEVVLPILDTAPTIDAVPVVRCKDCRYFKMYKCRMGYSNHDDYCSYGEYKSNMEGIK